MASKVAIALHGIVISFFLTGLYDVLLNVEENACLMSFMYETPKYKQVPLSDVIVDKYPRYGLYLYGEGHYFNVVSELQLEGIPVLYIPGNGGSMKQCRSVASFLLRKAEERQWDPHFNVFSVDLNEELVAFYGGTLNDQVEFVHHSIKAILKLYEDSPIAENKPQSVVIIGHSMGGIIARGIFALPDFDPLTVTVVYTLATPHVQPVFSLDPHIAEMYRSVNSYWNDNCEKLQDVTIISVSGGDRDFQVHGAAARLPTCLNHSLSTTTTDVPRAWVSADHQCAVWCKQVVLTTTRSLFDMVDPKTKQISGDAALRSKVMRHHFQHNSGVAKVSNSDKISKVTLLASHEVKLTSELDWSSETREINEGPAYFVFDLKMAQESKKVLVVARTTLKSERWVLACGELDCKTATDLSTRSYLTPKFKVVKLNITELTQSGMWFLIFKVPKQTKTSGYVQVSFLAQDHLGREYSVPHIFSNLWTLNQGYTLNETLGKNEGQFYHRITLSGLYSIFHAYKITVTPLQSAQEKEAPLVELELPDRPSYSYSNNSEMTVKLRNTAGYDVPKLHIYTDGHLEYEIKVKVQFIQLLGQILRFHGSVIPTMIALNGMLTFSYQLKIVLSGKGCLTTSAAHGVSAKPYKVQPFINLVKKLYTYETFFLAWHYIGLPVPDAVLLDDFGIWFALMPLVIFLYGAELFSFALYLEALTIRKCGSLFSKFVNIKTVEDWRQSTLSSTLHAVVLATLAAQSGAFALMYISLLNFVDLCALCSISSEVSNDKIEANSENGDMEMTNGDAQNDEKSVENKQQKQNQAYINLNIKLSMHMLWLCLSALALPSAIAWVKGYSSRSSDFTLTPAILGSLLFLLHRQQDAEIHPSAARRIICRLMYPLTIFTSMLCLHSLHRLPYYILSFMSLYVAMQYIG